MCHCAGTHVSNPRRHESAWHTYWIVLTSPGATATTPGSWGLRANGRCRGLPFILVTVFLPDAVDSKRLSDELPEIIYLDNL